MRRIEIVPAQSFTGYPDGVRRFFRAGEPAKVRADYAALLEQRGLIVPLPKPATKQEDDDEACD